MEELATNMYERIGSAIEMLEKELEYSPASFFGVAFWPDNIKEFVMGVVTLIFGLLLNKL